MRARAMTALRPAPPTLRCTCSGRLAVPADEDKVQSASPMPPWAAAAPRCTTRVRRTAIERAARLRRAGAAACGRRHVRCASTHVAPSAIHLRPNIPPQNRELHNALSALGGAAATWVNTSRLQLALSGLGVTNGVTRVAVLGLGSQGSAQRLARRLIADPLAAEAKWEAALSMKGAGAGAVLLK